MSGHTPGPWKCVLERLIEAAKAAEDKLLATSRTMDYAELSEAIREAEALLEKPLRVRRVETGPDGGPAFPFLGQLACGDEHYGPWTGLSARDWFAAQALAGILVGSDPVSHAEVVAAECYRIADAMLEARKR